jgi:hypothetical protein
VSEWMVVVIAGINDRQRNGVKNYPRMELVVSRSIKAGVFIWRPIVFLS